MNFDKVESTNNKNDKKNEINIYISLYHKYNKKNKNQNLNEDENENSYKTTIIGNSLKKVMKIIEINQFF